MRKYSSRLFAKIILLIVSSQVLMSCYSYKPLVKDQASKPMDEVLTKVERGKKYTIKLKIGDPVEMIIDSVDQKSIYGTSFYVEPHNKKVSVPHSQYLISDVSSIKHKKFSPLKTTLIVVIPASIIIILDAADVWKTFVPIP